jgi:argininosuccinate lyase
MAKIWQKDYNLDKQVEKFTVGNDFLLDKNLIKYDVYGSIAHSYMLNKTGILTEEEFLKLKKSLTEIFKLAQKEKFEIRLEDEDVHTAIENHLTKELGQIGKKIHTCRSRNDQISVDLRLYSKEKLFEVKKCTLDLAQNLIQVAEKHKDVPMPGFTHSRKAMPSSVGLLFGNYAEALMDDLKLVDLAFEINNQSPLGSGAGYGLPLNVDRELVADLLGFNKVQNNVLYVQTSRGKFESIIIFALSNLIGNLAKISNDLILFSMDEFDFFKLPDEFCTGSSIMPQKKNPDVFELVRAKSAKVDSNLYLVKNITSKLQSGYNRDFQLTKEPLMDSFEITLSSLKIFIVVINNLNINKENCISSCTNDLFAADNAYELVKKNVPFREAFKQTAKNMKNLDKIDPVENIKSKKHTGATGNLGLDKIRQEIKNLNEKLGKEISEFNKKMDDLFS